MIQTYVVTCIGATAAILAALISARNGEKANQIKILVNHRLDEALETIKRLEKEAGESPE